MLLSSSSKQLEIILYMKLIVTKQPLLPMYIMYHDDLYLYYVKSFLWVSTYKHKFSLVTHVRFRTTCMVFDMFNFRFSVSNRFFCFLAVLVWFAVSIPTILTQDKLSNPKKSLFSTHLVLTFLNCHQAILSHSVSPWGVRSY